ncbi:MAG TPA: orotidine-5'-phosphate decarboxylase [Chitinophagaceae bacterium]
MTREQLTKEIFSKKSYLCVGLDTDVNKIPAYLGPDAEAVFRFNKEIIDATEDLCVAYKINTAFYEVMGSVGWEVMERTLNYIPQKHFKIADAKRGDIGNTSSQYAKAFFETLNFDAITVAPYMGEDSISPFLEYENKWTILLGLTSNSGAADFELKKVITGIEELDEGIHITKNKTCFLYETVLKKAAKWGTTNNLMFVIGATQVDQFMSIRKIIPDNFLLVPGVGAQGGSLKEVSKYAMTKDCGLLVNVSRAIIYAGESENFAEDARAIALQYQREMANLLPQR